MTTATNPAPGYRLLPHERWFASWMLASQGRHADRSVVVRMRSNYGPVGVALWAAGAITVMVGSLLVLVAIVEVVATRDFPIFYALIAVAAGGQALAMLRARQGALVGRQYRGDRPFQRPDSTAL